MGGRAFIVTRLIRLYPFYILALALGTVELAYYYRNDHLAAEIILSSVFNFVMLPSPPVGIPYQPLFPANFVAWTLSFELFANAAYGFGFGVLTHKRLRPLKKACAKSAWRMAGDAGHRGYAAYQAAAACRASN